jgi:ABC-type transport system involved in multi-copper enzyme maturation permease subunit
LLFAILLLSLCLLLPLLPLLLLLLLLPPPRLLLLLLPLLGAAAASFLDSGGCDRGTISVLCYRTRAPSLIAPATTNNTSPPP